MAEPLQKKRKKDGSLYKRPAYIEKLLDPALEQPPEVIERRAYISEKENPQFFPTECLVHLLRAAFRTKNTKLRDMILPSLLKRCENLLRRGVSNRLPNAEYLRGVVLSKFGELLAIDANASGHTELDYYECKFNKSFRAFRITVLRSEKPKGPPASSFPVDAEGKTAELDPACLTSLFKSAGQVPGPEKAAMHKELCEAVATLANDDQKAIVLHFVHGYKIESVDPKERTVASICGVSGKTIQTRLSRALKMLAQKLSGGSYDQHNK